MQPQWFACATLRLSSSEEGSPTPPIRNDNLNLQTWDMRWKYTLFYIHMRFMATFRWVRMDGLVSAL